MKRDSTKLFSDRVEDYDRHRPSYPSALLDYLNTRCSLRGASVADVGAGTGILTKLLLERGAQVFAVEPNPEMGQAAARNLGSQPGFQLSTGTAEATGLADASSDLITCAQAFHWFDPLKTRQEFDRILKARGLIALIWNNQVLDAGLGEAYEALKVRFGGKAYEKITFMTSLDESLDQFFGAQKYESHVFENSQELNERGLIGRFFSTSYAPEANTTDAAQATQALRDLFAQFERGGKVRLDYTTELFLGH